MKMFLTQSGTLGLGSGSGAGVGSGSGSGILHRS